MIILIHITYSPIYLSAPFSAETDDICIAIDNGSNNPVGGSYYSAHQAVSKFAEHHIDMVCCVHRKYDERDVNDTAFALMTLMTPHLVTHLGTAKVRVSRACFLFHLQGGTTN